MAANESTEGDKRFIFWADDDSDDLDLFKGVLADLAPNYSVVHFFNGRSLLDYLASSHTEHYPALIILDINMPVMDGRATLAALKQNPSQADIPAVVLTTSESPMDREYCERLDTEMLVKPMTVDALKGILQLALAHAKK